MSLELLWKDPARQPHTAESWMACAYDDLQMEMIFKCFPPSGMTADSGGFRQFFYGLWTTDSRDIDFRNEAVAAFESDGALWEDLRRALNDGRQAVDLWEDRSIKSYGALMKRFSCARHYIRTFRSLRSALSGGKWNCECIHRLGDWAESRWEEESMEGIGEALDSLRDSMPSIPAMRIAVNVDDRMKPTHITGAPYEQAQPAGLFESRPGEARSISRTIPFSRGGFSSALQEYVYRELTLSQRLPLKKLAALLGKMSFSAMDDLQKLCRQFVFYETALAMLDHMDRRSLKMATARLAEEGSGSEVRGLAPLPLALDGRDVVVNDIDLQGFAIVTGANQSGKTMLITSVGQLQWLYQTGFPLPCQGVRLAPVDKIHTLFAAGEASGKYDSRMGYETGRLQAITDSLSAHCLVLLNEPMTSTSAAEAVAICSALIKRLSRDGIRGMMATHYVRLYHTALEQGLDPGYLHSLVMDSETDDAGDAVPTYRVRSMPPRSMDIHAIVREHNLSLGQLLAAVPSGADRLHQVADVIKTARKEAQRYGTASS